MPTNDIASTTDSTMAAGKDAIPTSRERPKDSSIFRDEEEI